MAKKKSVKSRVPKTRNQGTMSEAAFFGFIRAALRNKSRFWKPISACKQNSRRSVNKGRQKWEYQCAKCREWFADKEVQVDHIVECGTLRSFDDIGPFCERLFCEIEGFQVLCKPCHSAKTKEYMLNKG